MAGSGAVAPPAHLVLAAFGRRRGPGVAAGGGGGFLGGVEGREEAAGAGAQDGVEDGLQGREAGDHDADADFDLGPEHVARVGPGCVDVVDVGDGPAAQDGGGAGTRV